MSWIRRWTWVAIVVCLAGAARANNLVITNVALVNVTNGTVDIQFDVSWSNSWRYSEMTGGGTITNHDAAWVFVKYRAGADWHHALLSDTGNFVPAGTELKVGSSGSGTNAGVFILRSSDGHGGFVANGVRLHWDYVQGGLTGTNGVDISVHATEMVYIPEGPFYLGSGGTESGAFYRYPDAATPYLVTNEDEIVIGTATGNLNYAASGSDPGDRAGPIPSAFPKGYAAFYCMKYEITQGQYAQFLNRVPSGTDWSHFPNKYGQPRHVLRLTNGVYLADAPERACNWLSWSDLSVFLDWAGLRPMTELEFEKTCRGPLYPIPNEYAWGDTTVTYITGFGGVDGSGTETASPSSANCHADINGGHSQPYGPIRVGLFATAASTRHQAGAGYYGVMELSGDLEERAVTLGNAAGRAFLPTHGDGDTQTVNPGWASVITAEGMGFRGGNYYWTPGQVQTSARFAAATINATRNDRYGGRGVRSDR